MMRFRFLPPILAGITLTLGSFIFPSSSTANSNTYYCAQLNGVWITWGRDAEGGKYPLVHWIDNTISNWPPKKRCIAVSNRMKFLVKKNLLNYMSGGTVNNNPVVCGVSFLGQPCTKDNILLTLPTGSEPDEAVRKLILISSGASLGDFMLSNNKEQPLNETLDEPIISVENGQTYVNMEVLQKLIQHRETTVEK